MNAIDHNYLRKQPKSVLMGNVQYIFDRSDKSLSRQDATKNNILQIYMTYPTFLVLNKNCFKPKTPLLPAPPAQLLLPAPQIAGLLPAPEPKHIGKIVTVPGLSQTCKIITIYEKYGDTWATLEHFHGQRMVATRKLSDLEV